MSILSMLSKKLFIAENDLLKYIRSAPYRYKKYKIPKRNGRGYRDIAQPSKELKFIQKQAIKNLEYFIDLPVHESAMAYKKNTNIKDNARAHKNNSYLLKMDFANYFPSIRPIDFIKHIEKYKQELEGEDKDIVSSLFFYKRTRRSSLVLSIGAPTSPYISNTIMFDFDTEVYACCSKMGITYTRYADDLVFSTNEKGILFEIPDIIQSLIEKQENPQLTINENKTKFLSKSCNRHVTGLVISNDGKVSIGRKKKRQIKSMVYSFSKDQLSAEEILYLRGYLSYCNSVDKEFLTVLFRKYGDSYLKLINDDS